LGAVLYELLTGATPLERERIAQGSFIEILQRIREEEPPSPSARLRRSTSSTERALQRRSDPARLPKMLHGELDWIAMKALDKDRTRRYETVNGLIRDLQRYMQGEPVEAGPPSATYRIRKLVGRYRVWLAAAAVFMALLVAGTVVSSGMALRARRAEEVARAVNDFLQNDLLAQASTGNQARPGAKPDLDLKVRTALDRAAARIERKFPTQPVVEASIRQTIGRTYTDLGLYADAQRQVDRALELRQRALGESHPDTLASANSLAELYSRQSQYVRAEPLYTKTLQRRRQVLGENHPDTLASMNGLAIVLMFEGRFAQAEPLLANLLDARRRVLGPEHPDTLSTMNNLALEYLNESKYAQAQDLNRQVLSIRIRVLGQEHPLTLMSMNNLATSYKEDGKYAEAEPLYAEALRIQRRISGDEHPDTLTVMANLAELFEAQGKYVQAEPLYARALEAQRRLLGVNHRDTLYTMNSLAALYVKESKYTEAEKLFMEVWQSRRVVLGETHPDTLRTLIGLGWAGIKQQRYADAELRLRSAVNGYKTASSGAWEQYESQALLGISLAAQGKHSEAEPLLLSGCRGLIEHQAAISVEDRPALEEAKHALVQLYQAAGQPQKAAEWR
jgi:tetratricopeptide (TPR) repeat protein